MYGSSKEAFDVDYKMLRRLVLKGKMTKERAKIWIRETGQKVIASQVEMRNRFTRTRAGRDVENLNRIMKEMEKADE